MRGLVLYLGILIGLTSAALAQSFGPGDSVRLVERDIHIPAHPGPGDRQIPFRFVSGSLATVLSIDGGTGWVELRGQALNIALPQVGWITPRYIA